MSSQKKDSVHLKIEIIYSENKKKNKGKKKRSLRYLRDTIKHANIHITEVSEIEGKGQKNS